MNKKIKINKYLTLITLHNKTKKEISWIEEKSKIDQVTDKINLNLKILKIY